MEALRQGVILFAPYRDRDSLAVAYYYSTGIFGERKGPALKDKRRNILSKILRQKRENVTLDDMLPWVWSLVNPTEKIYWDHFEQTNPTWKEEAAEKLWPIRATLMAQMEVAEEDLIAPGARTAKDPWWAEWEERKAAELAAHYAHGYHYPEEAYHAQEGEAAAYETQHEHEQEQPPPQ